MNSFSKCSAKGSRLAGAGAAHTFIATAFTPCCEHAAARTRELSEAVSDLRRDVAARLPDRAREWFVQEMALPEAAADQVVNYVAETCAALGTVPTQNQIVAERFFDEAGGMQLVIHSPWGGAINRAWGMALRKRFCVSFD